MKDIASVIIAILWIALASCTIIALKKIGGLSFGVAAICGVPLAFALGIALVLVLGKRKRK